MEAMQKQRMRKVAITHFCLSVFVALKSSSYSAFSGSHEQAIWFTAWGNFWSKTFFLFQLQLLFSHFITGLLVRFPDWFGLLILISSVPFWSYCFGWIFVKLDNWLNHFPVLGKRVF